MVVEASEPRAWAATRGASRWPERWMPHWPRLLEKLVKIDSVGFGMQYYFAWRDDPFERLWYGETQGHPQPMETGSEVLT